MSGPDDAAGVIELFRTQYERYLAATSGRTFGMTDDRSPAVADVLSSLERGEISVRAALLQLKGGQHE